MRVVYLHNADRASKRRRRFDRWFLRMIAFIMNWKKNEKFVNVFVQIKTHHHEIILRVLLYRKIHRLSRRNERTHLRDLDDVKSIFNRRCFIFCRWFEMHEWLVISYRVEFLFFLRFNVALKASRRMLVDAINTFSVFIKCSAFKRKMLAHAEIAFFIVSTSFVDIIIFLTSKTLFDSALLFKIFANSMKIIV